MNAPTAAEIDTWPVTVDLPTAGRCFRLGRDASYEAARRGEFPVPVIRVGRRVVVATSQLRIALGIDHQPSTHARAMADRGNRANSSGEAPSDAGTTAAEDASTGQIPDRRLRYAE